MNQEFKSSVLVCLYDRLSHGVPKLESLRLTSHETNTQQLIVMLRTRQPDANCKNKKRDGGFFTPKRRERATVIH
jgi:hypothetical protein